MKATPFVVAEGITVRRGTRLVLDDVSLGVHPGERIGIVGRNGSGKTTLLRTLAGRTHVDGGRILVSGGSTIALVAQGDTLPPGMIREALGLAGPEHEWAGSAAAREVLTGLLGGLDAPSFPAGLDTPTDLLSGGESRRVALVAALLADSDVLLLDEPTNHLDVEAVQWLADHLRQLPRPKAVVVVTHDRWLLDAVTAQTWEVVNGTVQAYDGGYAAYVLTKAERERRQARFDVKRRNLIRKELAWLRRGAPARTSKPKFRIELAEELIGDEPPPRDSLALHRVATDRLGRTVFDVEHLTLRPAPEAPAVLRDVTWTLGPGDRIGLLGPNGVGKSTLLRLILGVDPPAHEGFVRRGKTVHPALVEQRLGDVDPDDRVDAWLRRAGERVVVTSGDEIGAGQLLESFGFTGDAPAKRLGDLSGGERRRLELLRTFLAGANVLMLDEPTNDLDIETLTVLEDLLDGWPGTLVVVSHDRYFLERVCDDVWAMLGNGRLRHLPRGVDEYLERRRDLGLQTGSARPATRAPSAPAEDRERRKALARVERSLERVAAQRADVHARMAGAATDPERLVALGRELHELEGREAALEEEWLALAVAEPGAP